METLIIENSEIKQRVFKTPIYTRNAIKRYEEKIMNDVEKKDKIMKYRREYYREYYHRKLKKSKELEQTQNSEILA